MTRLVLGVALALILLVGCSGGEPAPEVKDAPVAAGAVVGDGKKGDVGGRGEGSQLPPGQGRTGGAPPAPL